MSHQLPDTEPIYVYTAEQAVQDGVLVSAWEGELAEVTRQHVQQQLPVYLSRGLYDLAARVRGSGSFCCFEVIITGAGRRKRHTLFATLDEAGLTVMLPEDY